MCGINGIFSFQRSGGPVNVDELIRTRDHMAARGPDGKGLWVSEDKQLGLGHRRLAIVDLSDLGLQPMVSSSGRYVIVYNGEIYNYQDLRDELAAKGHRFRGHSDTEVLLALYEAYGDKALSRLRGMYVFAIYDTQDRELFLARDPFGIKPLYYANDGKTFRFASQVKALLAGGSIPRDLDPAGQVGFFLWGSVPEPFTYYRNISALPAGHTLRVDHNGVGEPTPFATLASIYQEAANSEVSTRNAKPAENGLALHAALLDSVSRHLIADVEVGAFLSAGIDSGSPVGLMRDAGQNKISTVTLAFTEFGGSAEDESPLAAEVAKRYKTQHTTRFVTRAEFESDLPKILEAMDQPSIDGLNTWYVSKAARELGLKVAISGLGGDELFGGYSLFRRIPRAVGILKPIGSVPMVGTTLRRAAMPLLRMLGLNRKLAGLLELSTTYPRAYMLARGLFMYWELDQVLSLDTTQAGMQRLEPLLLINRTITPDPISGFARCQLMDMGHYLRNQLLRDTDWASMANGLEVRVPLVDLELFRRIARHNGAKALTRCYSKLDFAATPSRPLPDSVVRRSKTGFTTPVERWLSTNMPSSSMDQSTRFSHSGRSDWSRQWATEIKKFYD